MIVSDTCSFFFFFSSRRRHTRFDCDWSSDVCSSDLRRRRQRPAPTTGRARRIVNVLFLFVASIIIVDTLVGDRGLLAMLRDRKSTRLNSSHSQISYAVFCLKKKKTYNSPRRHYNMSL